MESLFRCIAAVKFKRKPCPRHIASLLAIKKVQLAAGRYAMQNPPRNHREVRRSCCEIWSQKFVKLRPHTVHTMVKPAVGADQQIILPAGFAFVGN